MSPPWPAHSAFAAWCADSADCALRGRDAVAALDELMARADRGELVDPEFPDFPIDPEFLSRLVAFPVAETRDWQQLGELLARLRGTPLASRARRTDPEPVEDAYHAILCADWRFPISDFGQLRAYRAALRRIAPHLRVDGRGWDDVFSCQGFPVRVRNPQHRYRIAGTPPILMTNSRLDTSTPHEWAVSVARQVPRATLLTYDGVGHGDYSLSRCARAAIDRYLLTGMTPPRGSHCPAEPPSFAGHRPSWLR